MTGLDTNIIIRYLTQDDPAQSRKVNALMSRTEADNKSLFINSTVLCEVFWVLESVYDLNKTELLQTFEQLLTTGAFVFDDSQSLWAALTDYKSSKADISDCIIGRINKDRDCTSTLTFDRRFRDLSCFDLL